MKKGLLVKLFYGIELCFFIEEFECLMFAVRRKTLVWQILI